MDTLIAKANHYSQQAMDTWKLGAITATAFREVSELCLDGVRALREGDEAEAGRLIDQAAELINHLS